jgi:hypothetical protein
MSKAKMATDVLLHESVAVLRSAHEAFNAGNSFSLSNPDGSIVVFHTMAEFVTHFLRKAGEEDDEG